MEESKPTPNEVARSLGYEAEYELDLNNLPKLKHNWVKRGIKISCEGAGHPHHSHFFVQKR